MSRVLMNRVFAKDTFKVTQGTITSGWLPGQFFTLNSLGEATLANGSVDNTLFMGVDEPSKLASPPTGSLLSGIYGIGSKVFVDHSAEVSAGSSARAYDPSVELSTVGQSLYVNTVGKLTTASVGSVVAKVIQVPNASNNYTVGLLLRI